MGMFDMCIRFTNVFLEYCILGLASFCQMVEKNVFSMLKTRLAKMVFAGKKGFCRQKNVFARIVIKMYIYSVFEVFLKLFF